MTANMSMRAVPAPELVGAMTGAAVVIGTLIAPPVIIIFDNQSAVAVAISFDAGTTTWHTFPAGEAVIIDFRANHGVADNFALPQNTVITGTGASGNFSVSYFYARE